MCCTPPAGRGGLAAGELGVPFTQAEDDEEWQEWIDWEDVEKKSGGAGGSGAEEGFFGGEG